MGFIELEKQGRIGILTINRPEALNALNSAVLGELDITIDAIAADADIDVVVLTGAGRSFVAGADIGEMRELTALEGKSFGEFGSRVFLKLENLAKPVIAAVNGFALGGGCELAMACDIRIASEKAKFGQPETGLGIPPGFGGTQRLPRLVGYSRAMELIFSGRILGAEEAQRIGLVSDICPPEELLPRALELATQIAAQAQAAVRQAKACIRRGMQTDLVTGLAYESEAFGLCFATEDQKEGMSAFLEKRAEKHFRGR